MRAKTNLFQINGVPMLAPDAEVVSSFEDLDASDAGRDESGFMHRIVVRYKVGSWKFEYSHLTEEEKAYMESLFPDADTFLFQRIVTAAEAANVPVVRVASMKELGVVCGVEVATASAAIVK